MLYFIVNANLECRLIDEENVEDHIRFDNDARVLRVDNNGLVECSCWNIHDNSWYWNPLTNTFQ